MAQKTEYRDIEVKGSVVANKIVNPNKPANHLLRADGETFDLEELDALFVNKVRNPLSAGLGRFSFSLYENRINREYLSSYSNYCLLTNDYFIEHSVDGINFEAVTDTESVPYRVFNSTNSSAWTVKDYKSVRFTIGSGGSSLERIVSFYINCNKIKINHVIVEQQPPDSEEWVVLGEKTITDADNQYNYATYVALDMYSFGFGSDFYKKMRITLDFEPKSTAATIKNLYLLYERDKFLTGINNYFKLSYKLLECYSTVDYPITLNFDINNIEPTQTGVVEKKANWVLRYLLQAVNWLKKNYLPASVLDTKTLSDFSDLSTSQVNYLVDSTLTESIFNQKVTFPSDWKGRKICLTLAPVTFQKGWDYSLKVLFADYMKATGARLFVENDLAAMVGVNTLIKLIIDNNVIVIEAYIEA